MLIEARLKFLLPFLVSNFPPFLSLLMLRKDLMPESGRVRFYEKAIVPAPSSRGLAFPSHPFTKSS